MLVTTPDEIFPDYRPQGRIATACRRRPHVRVDRALVAHSPAVGWAGFLEAWICPTWRIGPTSACPLPMPGWLTPPPGRTTLAAGVRRERPAHAVSAVAVADHGRGGDAAG